MIKRRVGEGGVKTSHDPRTWLNAHTHTYLQTHTRPSVLSTLEELTPEVRGVLEEAIATVRAQEAEAREKVKMEGRN